MPSLDFMPRDFNYIRISESFAHFISHICLIDLQSWVNSAVCFLSFFSQGAKHSWRELCSLHYPILYVRSHNSSNFAYSPGVPDPRGSFISAGDMTSFAIGIKGIRLNFTFYLSNLKFFFGSSFFLYKSNFSTFSWWSSPLQTSSRILPMISPPLAPPQPSNIFTTILFPYLLHLLSLHNKLSDNLAD